jgi:type I restriction enzyme S subunit
MSKTETLKDCCSFQEGYVNPSQKFREYFGGNIKWLRASDLNGFFVHDTEKTLSQKGYESAGASAFMFKKDTLAISKSGTIGTLGILKDEMCGNRAVINIDVDKTKADLFYIFYLLKYKNKELISKAHGSIQKNLYISVLEQTKLNHRDLSTQQKIAAVLSALDAKIELNQRINAELESMAKTVFRYQFVENKEKGNWKIGILGDVAENIRRNANPSDISPKTHYIGLEHMPRKSIALAEYGNASELESNKYAFKTGEFLFGKLRPYFHKVGIAPVDGVCSTDILVIAPKSPEWYGFVLGHVSSDEIIKYADATSGGTKMPRTNWESLAKFEISMPPVELAKQFTDFFIPIAKQIRTNILESQTLTELRDWLLPMLMNGQVKV